MMKERYIPFILFCTLTVCFSCGRTTVSEDPFIETDEGIELKAERLVSDTAFASAFVYGLLPEDRMLLYCPKSEKQFALSRLIGDSLFCEGMFLRSGRGPYEIVLPTLLFGENGRYVDVAGIYNMEDKLYRVDVSEGAGSLFDYGRWRELPFPHRLWLSSICAVNDSLYLAQNTTDGSALFCLLDIGRDELTQLDMPFPEDGIDAPARIKAIAYRGKILKRPGADRFVYSAEYGRYILLFDLEGKSVRRAKVLSDRLPSYVPEKGGGSGFSLNPHAEYGTLALAVTDRYVYIGYNGMTPEKLKTGEGYKGYPFTYNDRINVFDWQGRFVARLILEVPVEWFSVAPGDEYIVANGIESSETGKHMFVRFPVRLPE